MSQTKAMITSICKQSGNRTYIKWNGGLKALQCMVATLQTVYDASKSRFHDCQLILQLRNYRLNLTAEFRFMGTYV